MNIACIADAIDGLRYSAKHLKELAGGVGVDQVFESAGGNSVRAYELIVDARAAICKASEAVELLYPEE